jgi:hypothetical protein
VGSSPTIGSTNNNLHNKWYKVFITPLFSSSIVKHTQRELVADTGNNFASVSKHYWAFLYLGYFGLTKVKHIQCLYLQRNPKAAMLYEPHHRFTLINILCMLRDAHLFPSQTSGSVFQADSQRCNGASARTMRSGLGRGINDRSYSFICLYLSGAPVASQQMGVKVLASHQRCKVRGTLVRSLSR